jgi:uncharacterized RDD family membrane protein YckC
MDRAGRLVRLFLSAESAAMSARFSTATIYTPPEGRVRELVTPEGIDLRLVLGDAGERAAAFLLDTAIILGVQIGLTLIILLLFAAIGVAAGELLGAFWILGLFLLRNFYFIAFELTPRGATPGKRALGLRVAMRDGGPLTAEAVFSRNAMREIELFLPWTILLSTGFGDGGWSNLAALIWCGVFAFFPLFNKDRLRVGDLVGGTWVVRAPKRVLDADLAGEGEPAIVFTTEALEAYGVKELNVLEDVIRKKDPEVIRAVAQRIRAKIGVPARELDMEFLQAYYAALRRHLEQRLLFGKRRRDKFDKG